MRDWGCGEPVSEKGVTVGEYGWGQDDADSVERPRESGIKCVRPNGKGGAYKLEACADDSEGVERARAAEGKGSRGRWDAKRKDTARTVRN